MKDLIARQLLLSLYSANGQKVGKSVSSAESR